MTEGVSGYKLIDKNGNYWGLRCVKSFYQPTYNIFNVCIVEGYNMTQKFQTQLNENTYRGSFEKSNLPFDEKVAAICKKYPMSADLSDRFKTQRFGLVLFVYADDIIGKIEIPPIYNSWQHVIENHIEGIGFFNEADINNEFYFFKFDECKTIKM